MAHDREVLIAWLNDAHAMEQAQVPVLENHARDAQAIPDIRARDQQHAEETRRHADLVRGCLEQLGERPSTAKSLLGSMIGNVQSVATGAFQDELVKNFLMDYASENLEIASYNALITAARDLGEENIARTCEQILRDEEAMADWLETNLPRAVRETMRT
ncbi:MAG: ferritin-like domain-containing protein [Gemmatimonadota bacterium]